MRRCMLVQTRIDVNKETKERKLWLTLCRLPNPMKNGGLFYPKASDLLTYYCVSEQDKPKDFEDFAKYNPGTLFDVTFGLNDYNNKPYILEVIYVPDSNKHNSMDLYVNL